MVVRHLHDQTSFSFEKPLDALICVLKKVLVWESILKHPVKHSHLDVLANKIGNLCSELADLVDGARGHLLYFQNAVLDRDPMVVLPERGRLVHDAGPLGVRHVRVCEHSKRFVSELLVNV
jgi:hypothetical protein